MAKDFLHETVKQLLIEDGWKITEDPYRLQYEPAWLIDLGAEKLFAAERGLEKIAVEVKSFREESFAHEFHAILGQYLNYRLALEQVEMERMLYLAVPLSVYELEFQVTGIQHAITHFQLKLLVYNPHTFKIQWIT